VTKTLDVETEAKAEAVYLETEAEAQQAVGLYFLAILSFLPLVNRHVCKIYMVVLEQQ